MKLREAAANFEAVWCIFDNTAEGAAIPYAFSLMQMLAEPLLESSPGEAPLPILRPVLLRPDDGLPLMKLWI